MARTPKVVEDRREQIIDAAMRVFAQKGYSKATNKDIAREAGITSGLIYYYFESKEALLYAILEARSPLKLMASFPPQALALPPEQFFPMLIRQALAIVEGEDMIGLLRVMIPELLHYNSAMSAIPTSLFPRLFDFLGNYVEAKVASGELRPLDVSLTVQTLISSAMGFVLRRQVLRDPLALEYTHEQIAHAIAEPFLMGILPR
ncbi:MAG TPA: helix-turn-helix domain-containing protein [Ktedonobacteraceae bacterium]|nr:helix-turn-helix domain-containing protein [Ktedonobacteraceae bacterium]